MRELLHVLSVLKLYEIPQYLVMPSSTKKTEWAGGGSSVALQLYVQQKYYASYAADYYEPFLFLSKQIMKSPDQEELFLWLALDFPVK